MKQVKLHVKLPVSFIREGKRYIAYTPALDISTSGKTYTEAQKRFGELVDVFFSELIKMGTLDTVLFQMGWEKKELRWIPPMIVGQELHTVCV